MGCKILIIDDEKYVREMIFLHLKEEGYEVLSASNISEGLRIAQISNPDLIITDLLMERGNGIDGIRKMRENQITVPIVVLSGQSVEEEQNKALLAGANGFIQKPILPPKLLLELSKYLKKD